MLIEPWPLLITTPANCFVQSLPLLTSPTQAEICTATWADPGLMYAKKKNYFSHRVVNFAAFLTKLKYSPKSTYLFTLLLCHLIAARTWAASSAVKMQMLIALPLLPLLQRLNGDICQVTSTSLLLSVWRYLPYRKEKDPPLLLFLP